MRRLKHGTRGTLAGFTLLELAGATLIMAVVGLAVMAAVRSTSNTRISVERVAGENRDQRRAPAVLLDELRVTDETLLSVTTLDDGNHEVTFQLPIDVDGVIGWGVAERSPTLGSSAQDNVAWSIRYTIEEDADANGGGDRKLVRQVLDDLGYVQDSDVVATGLRRGDDDPPGFHVVKNGDIWEITISTDGPRATKGGRSEEFHVWIRN